MTHESALQSTTAMRTAGLLVAASAVGEVIVGLAAALARLGQASESVR